MGEVIAPEGAVTARKAIQAKLAGDQADADLYASQTLEADRYANQERAAGRTARRFNVVGNAWSGWYKQFTRRPSG